MIIANSALCYLSSHSGIIVNYTKKKETRCNKGLSPIFASLFRFMNPRLLLMQNRGCSSFLVLFRGSIIGDMVM